MHQPYKPWFRFVPVVIALLLGSLLLFGGWLLDRASQQRSAQTSK